jgi:hypothetical protein
VELREFLHKKDTAGFRKKMRELGEKYASAEDRKIRDLRKNYHAAKTPEEKEKLRKELRESVRLQMEKRLEFTRGQIRSAEAKLQRLKKFYRDNLAEKDEIVEKITDFLCKEEKGMLRPRRRPPFMGERAIPPEEVKNRRPEPKK